MRNVSYILNKPLINEPGQNFQYYGGANFVLAEIIKNAAKINLNEFSRKYLFEPLRITPYHWLQLNRGVVDGAGGLSIRPRDMVKIGVTFLNKGIWNGQQIISEQWVDKSASSFPGNNWMNNWDDQYIMVMPKLNTVVVFTGGNYATFRPPFEILKKYILPAFN
ncbi:hypothetical protein MJD09_09705 [bacterium]|nr:hypothetical protein [bacterium]